MQIVKQDKAYWVLIALFVAAILCSFIFGVSAKDEEPAAQALPAAETRPASTGPKVVSVEKLVEVEKEITAEMVQEGLRDMGFLISGEYYFTEVVSYTSVKKLWNIELPFTESGYLVSYDGVVTAGVDFSRIRVEKDDEKLTLKIILPKAEIKNIDIDTESFQLHHEKTGFGNSLKVEDYNSGLVTLERTARSKAIQRDLPGMANKNARNVIRNFVSNLVDTTTYTLIFE